MTKHESAGEVKLLANRMAQLEFAFKDKGSHSSRSFSDLALFKDEPLPDDFKLPNFAKFNGTGDPRVHLRQYATFMAATKLTESQIVQFFFTSLEEGPRAWFFDLEDEIKSDWLLLTQKFIKQYEYNTQLDITRRDLETTKQKPGESFSDYVARWRAKAVKMRNRPPEDEQIELIIKGSLPHFRKQMIFAHYPDF